MAFFSFYLLPTRFRQARLKAGYRRDYVSLDGDVDLRVNGPIFRGSAVFMWVMWSCGLSCDLSVKCHMNHVQYMKSFSCVISWIVMWSFVKCHMTWVTCIQVQWVVCRLPDGLQHLQHKTRGKQCCRWLPGFRLYRPRQPVSKPQFFLFSLPFLFASLFFSSILFFSFYPAKLI